MSEKSPGHRPKKAKNRTTKRKQVDETRTGWANRQQFTAPREVAHLTAEIARVRGTAMNGPAATGLTDAHGLFGDLTTMFRDKDVSVVFDAIRHTDVAEFLDARHLQTKGKPGRPTTITHRALLVGLMLTAIDGRGCLASEVARTLYRRLHPTSMALLDVKPLPPARSKEEQRQQTWMIERRVRNAIHRLLDTIDPSIHPKGTAMAWEQLRRLDKPLTAEEVEERQVALSIVCNSILQVPFDLLPEKVKQKYRGSACIDATPVRVHSRGRSVYSEEASADPDAGWYVRTGDHSETGTDKVTKALYGFDLNLIVAVCDHLGDRQYLPALPIAQHLDRPGMDPAGAARRMFAYLASRNFQPRYLAGDGLYAQAHPAAFHDQARKTGWKLVMPILDAHLGVQAAAEGFLMVEGHWYCPSIPKTLIEATGDFRAKAIDLDTYETRIAERAKYRARLHEDKGENVQRYGCPAYGTKATVMCALKPRSQTKDRKLISQGPTLPVRLRERIKPDPATATNGIYPKPCRVNTISIDHSADAHVDAARHRQDLVFGTREHTDTYNALRQSQEGLHGFIKDEAKEALASPGKRRIRGLAAQSLFSAVLLAAAGIRKVRAFLARAKADENGDLYVERRERTGDHATSHLPPGTAESRGDPDPPESDTDGAA